MWVDDKPKISAVLYQLSYPANWEVVVMWVDDKPIGSEYIILVKSN